MSDVTRQTADQPPVPPDRPGSHNHLPSAPEARRLGVVNWRGLWTLYLKEVQRFFKVFTQTVAAPIVTTLLFFVIFRIALGGGVRTVGDIPFVEFLAPGLIMMAMLQNAFANTSSSLMISKIQGNIIDVLMPPLSAAELTVGFVAGGVTRGIFVGLATGAVLAMLVPIHIHDPWLIVFHALSASMMLSLFGMIGGIWAEKFDQIAAVTNFVVMPLSFLSGTFYSIQRLPDAWQTVAHFNPFFYMIDGFRSGFIGQSDADPLLGVAVMTGVNAVLFLLTYWMMATGYRLKA
ncbi:MAG: ABC transporter permease [Alphaproteobacteria bacterium]